MRNECKMFEEQIGQIISIDDLLEKEYGYIYNGDEEDFLSQDFIELEGIGFSSVCWIKYKNKRYLFKKAQSIYEVWGELISMELANQLEIECAKYRFGTLHGHDGIISESFLTQETTLHLGIELFENYLDKHEEIVLKQTDNPSLEEQKKELLRTWNQLEFVKKLMKEKLNNSYYQKNADKLILIFLLDLITLQIDRNPKNWGIITENNKIEIAPLFDNSMSFGFVGNYIEENIQTFRNEYMNATSTRNYQNIYSFIYRYKPSFYFNDQNIVQNKPFKVDIIPNIFKIFLENSDKNTLELVYQLFDKLDEIDLDKIISNIETKNELKMDDDLYFYIFNILTLNIKFLKNILEKYKKKLEENVSKGK